MKKNKKMLTAIAALMLVAFPLMANAQLHRGPWRDYGPPRVSRYYASLAEDYNVPYRDIREMHGAGVTDDDMPGILYIYTHSHYSLRQIYSLRLRGATWENLSNWCGVPLCRDRSGPPFGNAYGYYRNGPGRYQDGPGRWDREDNQYHGQSWEDRGGVRQQEEHSEDEDDD